MWLWALARSNAFLVVILFSHNSETAVKSHSKSLYDNIMIITYKLVRMDRIFLVNFSFILIPS